MIYNSVFFYIIQIKYSFGVSESLKRMFFEELLPVFVNTCIFEKVQVMHKTCPCGRTVVPSKVSAKTIAVIGYVKRMLKSRCKMMMLVINQRVNFIIVKYAGDTAEKCNCFCVIFIIHIEFRTSYFHSQTTFPGWIFLSVRIGERTETEKRFAFLNNIIAHRYNGFHNYIIKKTGIICIKSNKNKCL